MKTLTFALVVVLTTQVRSSLGASKGVDVEHERQLAIAQIYDTLSALPLPVRKQVFAGLPATDKAELWRWHLRIYEAEHAGLTPDQRAMIQSVARAIDPRLYELDRSTEQWQLLDRAIIELQRNAGDLFTVDESYDAFGRLGPEGPSSATPGRLMPKSNEWLCNCAVGLGDWCFSSTCVMKGCSVDAWCGWAWFQECTGVCVRG